MAGTGSSDETRPLLSAEPAEDPQTGALKTAIVAPLPSTQIFIVSTVRVFEPIAFSQIFPYINEFISDLHVTDDPKRIGFYSGLVESTFAIFQLMSTFYLARLSDRIGRRPVILVCTTGLAIATILFGLSSSLPMMLAIRATAGLFSGNAAVMHAVIGDIANSAVNDSGWTVAVYTMVWPAGIVLGPLLGGSLSHPAKFFSWLDYEFLRNHPYFLPGFIAGCLALLGSLIGYLFLEETLPSKRLARAQNLHSAKLSTRTSSTPHDDNDVLGPSDPSCEPQSIRVLLSDPVIRAIGGSGFALAFLTAGFEVIFVLYCFSSIENGGLGFPTHRIGYLLSTSGILSVTIQLLFLPYLLRTFNKAKMYHFCMALFPCMFCLLSILNPIARSGLDPMSGVVAPRAMALIWVCIGVLLLMARFATVAFAFSIMLVKENSPSPASLGTTNGFVQVLMCLARAFGPALVSSVYAVSVDNNILGGFAWALVMVLISLGGVWQSAKIARVHRLK